MMGIAAFRHGVISLSFATLAMASGCVSAPEFHLIPSSYQGDIFIMSDIPSGAEPQREGLAKVYTILEAVHSGVMDRAG